MVLDGINTMMIVNSVNATSSNMNRQNKQHMQGKKKTERRSTNTKTDRKPSRDYYTWSGVHPIAKELLINK